MIRIAKNPRITQTARSIVFASNFDDKDAIELHLQEALEVLAKEDGHQRKPPMMVKWFGGGDGSWVHLSRHDWGYYLMSPTDSIIFIVTTDPILAKFQTIADDSGLPLAVLGCQKISEGFAGTENYRLQCTLNGQPFEATGGWTGSDDTTGITLPRLFIDGKGKVELSEVQ